MLFEWSDDYKIGHEKIDHQHKHLFDILSRFFELVRFGVDEENLVNIIIEFQNYADVHFLMEENLLKERNDDEYESHKRAHDIFRNWLSEKLLEDKPPHKQAMEILSFMSNWLLHHILEADKELFGSK